MFVDHLIEKITKKDNPSVIGLDPKIEYVPEYLKKKAFSEYGYTMKGATEAILAFNLKLIDAIHDIVPAIKPQMAYYEMYGLEGIEAFQKTIAYAKERDLIIITDGKRNDIGTTAQAYSSAYLGATAITSEITLQGFASDALTVNPYLGFDGIKPFIDDCKQYNKGIFVLVKTSNQSSGQLQDLRMENGKTIYEVVAALVEEWGSGVIGESGYSSIGAVVGATYPEQAKSLREMMKNAYILVPGYGAQGGTARDAMNSFNKDGLGAIVNASRSIMCAYQSQIWKNDYNENQFESASRAEAIRMKDELNNALKTIKS